MENGLMKMYARWNEEVAERRAKWAYLTEGIKNDLRRRITETLLDNQESYSQAPRLMEDLVTTSMVTSFTTFAYPMIRRVFPRLLASELVSTQPMSQPTGKVFYFDIEYSSQGSPPVNQRVDLVANRNESYTLGVGEGGSLPELNLQISSQDVSAESRKLKAKWSLESEQDLFAYFGLSAENELMTALSDEIAREIDRSIISELFSVVTQNVNWSYTQPTSGPWSLQSPKEFGKTLYDALVDANNLIFSQRYRNATWIVAGTNACGRLEKLEQFRLFPAPDPNQGEIVTGPNLFGTIAGRYSVYKDPWLDSEGLIDTILLGYKGNSPLDTGYIFAPYIPLMTTAPFTDPNSLTTVRAMMTRYATKAVIPEMFATVTITP